MKKLLSIILALIIIACAGGFYYLYFYILNPTKTKPATPVSVDQAGFSPFGNNAPEITPTPVSQSTTSSTQTNTDPTDQTYKTPKLRQLSTTPVSGMAIASSTSNISVVRFMDRGTGYVYESDNTSNDIRKISNTTIPQIYEAYGNKNATAFLIRYLKSESDMIVNFYAELRKTGTTTSETSYEIKGRFLSPDVKEVAVSPAGDKVFTWNIENGDGVGYISSFDEKVKVKIVSNPLTQVNIDWPEANTVLLSSKASSVSSSFVYTIDTKSGLMKKVLGGMKGLTAKASHDLSKILYSTYTGGILTTSILNTKDNTTKEVIFRTLSEKCVWGNLRKNEVYCAVPTQIQDATYPDAWYKGDVSFKDQIWHLNTSSGEVHLVADPLSLADQSMDATNLILDSKDNFLYFVNKNDLTLWALDLNQ